MSGTVKRALELAPECKSMKELVKRLNREGLPDVHAHLGGTAIRKELHRRLDKGAQAISVSASPQPPAGTPR